MAPSRSHGLIAVARWPTGVGTVEYLLERDRLERIDADDFGAIVDAIVERARRRLSTSRAALDLDDFDGAYSAAYDAYRMSAESLLARQGLRATGGEGSHMTVEDAISAQFTAVVDAFAKPTFERMRRTRHRAQYFDPSAAPISADDARWAIGKTAAALVGVEMLLGSSPPDRFS